MENTDLIFDIRNLLEAPIGTSENYSFEVPIEYENLVVKSNITGKLQTMRLESAIFAHTTNVKIELEFICSRCLKAFTYELSIPSAERHFFLHPPVKNDDPQDTFLINRKKHTIDLTEMLRQEIILHLPVISVCSNGCKGLCPVCGVNLNATTCDCKVESIDTNAGNKPLSILKELIK